MDSAEVRWSVTVHFSDHINFHLDGRWRNESVCILILSFCHIHHWNAKMSGVWLLLQSARIYVHAVVKSPYRMPSTWGEGHINFILKRVLPSALTPCLVAQTLVFLLSWLWFMSACAFAAGVHTTSVKWKMIKYRSVGSRYEWRTSLSVPKLPCAWHPDRSGMCSLINGCA